MAFTIESGGKRHDQLGRHLQSLRGGDPATGLHLDVDDDKDKAVATRKRILDMAATDKLLVAGYHMPFPGLGYVEKAGGAYRWVPVGYRRSASGREWT